MANVAFAAAVPVKGGLVQDNAAMFTSKDLESLKKKAEGDTLTFHILTMSSLDGQDAKKFATDVYKAWSLTSKDIILLISLNDHHVEMNFNNPSLQRELDAWKDRQSDNNGSSAITQLLDKHFIPYAKDGSFSKASMAMMNAVYTLAIPLGSDFVAIPENVAPSNNEPVPVLTPDNTSSVNTSPLESTSPITQPSTNEGHTPISNATTSPETSGFTFMSLAIILVIVLFIVIGVILSIGLLRRKQLKKVSESLSTVMVSANNGLESIGTFNGIAQGKTGDMVQGILKRLSDILIELSRLQSEMGNQQISLFKISELHQSVKHYRAEYDKVKTSVEAEEQQIAIVVEADRTAKQKTDMLEKEAVNLAGEKQALVNETGLPLDVIQGELDQLGIHITKASELELFDPIAALQEIEVAENKLNQTRNNVKDVLVYIQQKNEFPSRLLSSRNRVDGIIEENHLRRIKVKPHETLEQSRIEMQNLALHLDHGDMNKVRELSEYVDALLDQAVAMTERQAELRKTNKMDLEALDKKLLIFQRDQEKVQQQLVSIRMTYVSHHWADGIQKLDELRIKLEQDAQLIPEINIWTDDEHQEFDKAREAIDQLLHVMEDAEASIQSNLDIFKSLENRLSVIQQALIEYEGRYVHATRLLKNESNSLQNHRSLTQALDGIPIVLRHVKEDIKVAPYDLDKIEETLEHIKLEIVKYESEVQEFIQHKQQIEQMMQKIDHRYDSLSHRARSYRNIRSLNNNHSSQFGKAQQMLMAGMFIEAEQILSGITDQLDDIEKEIRHAQMLEEQRQRDEEARQRAAAQAASNQSNSSSGSSWSSSDQSSGGSSFNSNDNNSSGGSKW
ncbi:TPM domain-containing protein [Paenibacillus glacialis]|nr:TPM domain-containing protein [Paenibacillus glacialis]